nr:MAG TPA: holin [Caudoviricetes sp.]
MEQIMNYVTYGLMVIGVMAFLVSGITQAIKEMPYVKKVQTNVVALLVSLILCPIVLVAVCQYFKVVIIWYYVFASFIAAFIVYLVATGGWERVHKIWERSKYEKK